MIINMASKTRSNPLAAPADNVFLSELFSEEPPGSHVLDQCDVDDYDTTCETTALSYQWSDTTVTESATGRSSYCSWTGVEGELDRLASETVQHMFNAIDHALYKDKSTKMPDVDRECLDWSGNFMHFRVDGNHILNREGGSVELLNSISVDDGMITPTNQDNPSGLNSFSDVTLGIDGHGLNIVKRLTDIDVNDPYEQPGKYYEELIVANGEVMEYFAFDASGLSNEECVNPKKVPRLRHDHGLPPITPSACVRDTACNLVFDQVWSEVITVLQPLLLKQNSLSSKRNEGMLLNPPLTAQVPIHEFFLPNRFNQQLPPTRGSAPHSVTQPFKQRLAAPGPLAPGVPTHSTDLPNLQKVITIRPVPLQQRLPSSTLPAMGPSTSNLLVPHDSQDTFVTFMSPDTSRTSRPSYTSLSMRNSEPKILSAKIGIRRNPLKPLEIPKSSSVHQPIVGLGHEGNIREFSGVIGQRLVRHMQLPPLDAAQLEKSPELLRSNTKRHVSFSNRIVSAAPENREIGSRGNRCHQTMNYSELRPSTTNTVRSETPSRHGVQSTLPKVIGHAASLHHELNNDTVLWEAQEEENNEEDAIQDGANQLPNLLPLQSNNNPRSGYSRSRIGRR